MHKGCDELLSFCLILARGFKEVSKFPNSFFWILTRGCIEVLKFSTLFWGILTRGLKEASKFSDENKKELMDLLQLYVDSEKNMSRSGVAKALMQILKTQ